MVSRYQKAKSSQDLNEARDDGVLGCSGISWTTWKQSAPCSRQTTTPTPHHWIFTGRMLFLAHNQQCQSTEDKKNNKITCHQNQTQTSLTCLGYFRGRPRGLLVGVVSTGAAGMVSSSATTAPSLSTPISRPASCCTWAHKPHTSLYYMRQSTRFCMDTSKLTLYVGGMAWWLAEFVAITRLTHVGPG